jgi:hypothetical protein
LAGAAPAPTTSAIEPPSAHSIPSTYRRLRGAGTTAPWFTKGNENTDMIHLSSVTPKTYISR